MQIVTDFGDLRPAASHILEVEVAAGRSKLIRQSAILAADTDISMETVELADEDLPRSGKGPSAKKGEVAGTLTGAGNLRLRLAQGEGSMWLGRGAGDIAVVAIDEKIVVVAQAGVLALDANVSVSLSTRLPKLMATTRKATYAWTLAGHGQMGLATAGEIVAIDVTPDRPIMVETEAVVAYSAGVDFTEPEDFSARLGKRGVKFVLANIDKLPGIGLSVNTGRERVWAIAEGAGTLLVANQGN